MRRRGRPRLNPVARRVALREEALERYADKLDEFEDGARENVRMLALLEDDLRALEEEVFALVEAALEDEPSSGPASSPPGPRGPGG